MLTRDAMRKFAFSLGMLALTACASRTTTYLRTDGQDIASNPALRQQMELDRTICQTEPGDDRDCMAVKGYVSVPKDQAAAKQQQLAAIAAENAKHETVSELPALRSTTSPKTLAGKKQKAKPSEATPTSSQD
jgi:hypothetical protein